MGSSHPQDAPFPEGTPRVPAVRRQGAAWKTERRHRSIEQLILIQLQCVAIVREHRERRRVGERLPIRCAWRRTKPQRWTWARTRAGLELRVSSVAKPEKVGEPAHWLILA